MQQLARWLFQATYGCAKVPLLAAVAFILCARLLPVWGPSVPNVSAPFVGPQLPSDAAVIDGVLAKRGPELGLTLRTQLTRAISEEAERAGYDPLLILAIIDVESDFEERALSSKGARGLMQVKPSTLHFVAQKEGVRLSSEEVAADPALCVRMGIRYLRRLHDQFGELDRALMAYNAGPNRLRAALKQGELPEAYLRYPRLVRRDYQRFRQGAGLGGDWAWASRSGASGTFP